MDRSVLGAVTAYRALGRQIPVAPGIGQVHWGPGGSARCIFERIDQRDRSQFAKNAPAAQNALPGAYGRCIVPGGPRADRCIFLGRAWLVCLMGCPQYRWRSDNREFRCRDTPTIDRGQLDHRNLRMSTSRVVGGWWRRGSGCSARKMVSGPMSWSGW